MDKSAEKNDEFKNYYKNVVYLSDKAVGRLLHHIRSSKVSDRTVVFYTSDHGESFREHWQLGHTSSVYEEEIRVPAWIDAPKGTLSEDEVKSLESALSVRSHILGAFEAAEEEPDSAFELFCSRWRFLVP